MKRISFDELHSILYKRFKMVHEFLVNHEIEYFGIGGTALGAFREGKIIEWDDDIDIGMTRKNYEKFLKIANQLNSKYLHVVNYHNKKYIEHPITKICLIGVEVETPFLSKKYNQCYQIDVFPLDYIYSDDKKQKKLIEKVERIKKILYIKSRALNSNSVLKRFGLAFLKLLLCPLSCNKLCKKYDTLVLKPYKTNCYDKNYLWTSNGVYEYKKELHKTIYYGKPTLCKFGPIEIYIPEDSEHFLIDNYGEDFMKPYDRSNGANLDCILTDKYVE